MISPALYTSRAWTSDEFMNRLQNAGVISDNCIGVEDIARADFGRVVEWVERNYPVEKRQEEMKL